MKKIILFISGFFISTFIHAQDLGIESPFGGPTAPLSGCNLSNAEVVKIRVFNFGPGTATGPVNISYSINGGAPVSQSFTVSISQNSSSVFTFTTPANLSAAGTYNFTFTISGFAGDANAGNDVSSGYSVVNTTASSGGAVTGGGNVCISGNSGVLTLVGQTGSVVNWESSEDFGQTWVSIGNTSTSQSYLNIIDTIYYRAVVQNGNCVVRSLADSIFIDLPTIAGSVSGTTSQCSGTNSGTLTSTGRRGSVIGWQSSLNAGFTTPTNIAQTTASITYSNLTATTFYRVEIKNGACPAAFSSSATITVNPVSVGGSLTGSATVCSGSNSGSIVLSGHVGSVQNWENSTNGGANWTAIANTTTTLTYTNISQTTLFRVNVKSGVCPSTFSGTATITVTPPSVGGTVSSSATVCTGTNSGLLVLTGFSGNIVRWESSINGGTSFTNIASTNDSINYNNLTSTTIFRAVVQNTGCPTANSSTATITVTPLSSGGNTTPNFNVCRGINSGSVTLTGQIGNVVRWETSADGINWTTINNTSTSQAYSNLSDTTFYRAVVQSGSCPSTTSSINTIFIDEPTIPGSVSSDQTICGGVTGSLTLSGNNGSVVRWELSTNAGTSWQTINNTTTTQNFAGINQTTVFRAIVKNGSCTEAASSTATLNVIPQSEGGTITGSTTLCSGSGGTLNLVGRVGDVLSWESSVDNGSTWTNITNTTAQLNFTNISSTTLFRAIVQNGTCAPDTSTIGQITVDQTSVGGTVNSDQFACFGSNSGTLQVTGITGVILRWEFSVDGGNNWQAVSNTSNSLNFLNITQTTKYRVVVKNGICNEVNSQEATVTVVPGTVPGTIQGGNISVCATSNSGTLSVVGNNGNVQDWQISTDQGQTWTNTGNSNNSFIYNNLSDTTWFRAVINGPCGSDTTAFTQINVSPTSVGGTLSGDATVCSGNNNGILQLSGETGNILNWESSTDGGFTWLTISNTSNSQTFNNINQTTLFRVNVKSGGCPNSLSSLATITVLPATVTGSIQGGNISVCETGNNGALNLVGFVGNVVEWQSSTDAGLTWISISNNTSIQTYSNLSIPTSYRAIVSGSCGNDTTQAVSIGISTAPVAGILSSDNTVCAGSNNDTLRLAGFSGTIQGWESSINGGLTWTSILNTTDSLIINNLNTTTSYRVLVSSGGCSSVISTLATITVIQGVQPGSIQGAGISVCAGNNAGTLILNGNSGSVTEWQSSTDDGLTWTSILNTTVNQSYSNLTDTTWYRVIVSGLCGIDTTDVVEIKTAPNSIGGTISGASTVCSGSNRGTLRLTGYQGNISGWEFSNDGGFNWIAVTNTTDSLVYNNLTQTTSYRAKVSNGICSDAVTNNSTIIVNPASFAGNLSGAVNGCKGSASGTIKASGIVGNVLLWQSSINDGGTWSNISNTTTSLNYSNLSQSTSYRIVVANGTCVADSGQPVQVVVYPKPVVDAGRDTSISLGSSIELNASAPGTVIASYSWTPSRNMSNAAIQNPIYTPIKDTVVSVIVTDIDGCVVKDSLVIKVVKDFKINIANVLTPNGDGFNDTWIIENLENYPNTEVVIVNRFGQELFNSSSYDNTWSGTNGGKQLPDGTYYYVVKLKDSDKVFKGGVTIINAK